MNNLTSAVLRVVGDARWLLAVASVIVTGAWLGKRLGRYSASYQKLDRRDIGRLP